MYISQVYVKGFRSLEHVEVSLSNYTTLIGKNDSGKSSFLKALQLLFDSNLTFTKEDLCKFANQDGEFYVEAVIEECFHESLNLKAEPLRIRRTFGNAQSQLLYLGKVPSLDILNKMSQGTLLRQELKEDISLDEAVKEFIDEKLKEFYPKNKVPKDVWFTIYSLLQENDFILYKEGWCLLDPEILTSLVQIVMLEADVRGEDEITGTGRSVLNQVGGALLRESTKKYEGIETAVSNLKEQIEKVANRNEDGKWIIEEINNFESIFLEEVQRFDDKVTARPSLTPPQISSFDFLVNVHISDEWIDGLDKMGHGLRRSVVFAMLRTHRRLKEENLSFNPHANSGSPLYLFLIEEPELYLHPQAERRRKKELKQLSENENSQVILCTHSAIFVDLTEYRGVLRFDRPERKASSVQAWSGEDLADDARKSLATIYKFDPNRSAMLFADLVILVEGQSEKVAIPHIAEKLKLDSPSKEIEIVDCNGNTEIPIYQMILEGFGINYIAWLDSDDKSAVERAKEVRNKFGKIITTENNWETMTEIPNADGKSKKPYRSWKHFIIEDNEPNQKVKDRVKAAYNWQDFE